MRFLSIEIQGEQFGIELEKVKEVIAFPQITPTPGTPPYFLGLMRLRDQVLPVLDLRIRMKLTPTLTHDTAIVVCEVANNAVGVVVDIIHTVISPEEKDVTSTPMSIEGQNVGFITQVIRRESGLTLILDIGRLLNASDEELIKSQSALQQMRSAA